MKPYKSYHESLIKALEDPDEAAEYLNAVLEDSDKRLFLVALKQVAEARGGMAKLSRSAKLSRPNLYRSLSKTGNPEFGTLANILNSFGLKLAVIAKHDHSLRAA